MARTAATRPLSRCVAAAVAGVWLVTVAACGSDSDGRTIRGEIVEPYVPPEEVDESEDGGPTDQPDGGDEGE